MILAVSPLTQGAPDPKAKLWAARKAGVSPKGSAAGGKGATGGGGQLPVGASASVTLGGHSAFSAKRNVEHRYTGVTKFRVEHSADGVKWTRIPGEFNCGTAVYANQFSTSVALVVARNWSDLRCATFSAWSSPSLFAKARR